MSNLKDRYKLIPNPIGKGAFGTVYKVKEKGTGNIYAAKISRGNIEDQKEDLKREVENLSSINHPLIVKFIEYSEYDFEGNRNPVIITEYCPNKSLRDVIDLLNASLTPDGWTEAHPLINMYAIAAAMSFLHSKGVILRNLKPEKILMDENYFPKIADFGLSKNIKNSKNEKTFFKGTLLYAPPEYIEDEDKIEYTKKGDVYSYAMIVYQLITNEIPFSGFKEFQMKNAVLSGKRPEIKFTPHAFYKNLIEHCWAQDPSMRPDFDDIIIDIKHHISDLINDDEQLEDFKDFIEQIETNPENAVCISKIVYKKDDLIYPLKEFNNLSPDLQKDVRRREKDPKLIFELAKFLIKGTNGYPKNTNVASIYLQNLVLYKNSINAAIYYSILLIKGDLIEQDLESAKRYLIKYKDENNADIYYLLGIVYKKQKEYLEARKYFKKAINKGKPEAIYEYGKLQFYGKGKGGIKDLSKAKECFLIAKENGINKCDKYLKKCDKELASNRKHDDDTPPKDDLKHDEEDDDEFSDFLIPTDDQSYDSINQNDDDDKPVSVKKSRKKDYKSTENNHFDTNDYLINLKNFKLIQKIDQGWHFITQTVVNKENSTTYTSKTIINNINEIKDEKKYINKLILTLSQFNHPTIIKFNGFSNHDFEGNKSTSLIFDYAKNGLLSEIIKKTPPNFTNTNRQIILIGIARSFMLLLKHNIIHGDLKTYNILLDENYYPKLTDFCNSIIFKNPGYSPLYTAPEILYGELPNKKSDVFSFGILMYEFLTNRKPYSEQKDKTLFKLTTKITNGLRPQFPENFDSPLKTVIESCWQANPNERPSFEELFYMLAYNKNYYLNDVNSDEVMKYVRLIQVDLIFCTICHKQIENDDLVYFSGYPYHTKCVKCSICNKELDQAEQTINDFVRMTPNLFLCQEHFNESQNSPNFSPEFSSKYQAQIKKNFVKETFELPPFNNDNISQYSPEEIFIDSEMINNSFRIDKPYDLFIPTATIHLEYSPLEIDFTKLQELLGEEIVILQVLKGSTFLKIAFIATNQLHKIEEKFIKILKPIKDKLTSPIGKSIVGNLVEDPKITIPKDDDINKIYDKKMINLLQSTQSLEKIEMNEIKEEVFLNLKEEKYQKNWTYLFLHQEIYDRAEKQIREDIINNPFEMIYIGQTIIANKYFDNYEKIKNKIPPDCLKECFLYHGSRLANHLNIVKENFLPKNKVKNHKDEGFFGRGIYATDNMFYAAGYSNYSNYVTLSNNSKGSVFCCSCIYNKSYINEVEGNEYNGIDLDAETIENYGINHAFVGSSNHFKPIEETDIDKNRITGNEYVFGNRFQIIPIFSFTIMKSEYFLLWKDEKINNKQNSISTNIILKRIQINAYFKNNNKDALDLIKLKRRNKIKLITNGGKELTGKDLIDESRKIIGSNFVCLVYANSLSHLEWIKEKENVLFTKSHKMFLKFAEMDMTQKNVLDYIKELEAEYKIKFKIKDDELLKFPLSKMNIENCDKYLSNHLKKT